MIVDLRLPELLALPGGEFVMGNDQARADERPAHAVSLAPFRAAVRPVSNAEYAAFVKGAGQTPPPFLNDPRFANPEQPVAGISWFDAVAFCRWLARESGIPFRLPTEAEREFAALGGLERADWPWGDEPPDRVERLAAVASLEQPHLPGPECANGYGLLCMADNLHEWCTDWYDAGYYALSPAESPAGPATGKRRTSRGGSWRHQIKFNRVSARSSLDPGFHYNDYGFRVYANA